MEVEVACVIRFCVDEQPAATDVGREVEHAGDDVDEEAGAESVSFMVGVHGEAGEERDGLGVAPRSLAQPRWRGDEAKAAMLDAARRLLQAALADLAR